MATKKKNGNGRRGTHEEDPVPIVPVALQRLWELRLARNPGKHALSTSEEDVLRTRTLSLSRANGEEGHPHCCGNCIGKILLNLCVSPTSCEHAAQPGSTVHR